MERSAEQLKEEVLQVMGKLEGVTSLYEQERQKRVQQEVENSDV